jgi:RNA polymerase sigma-70 factor (ECF subfamily)
MAAQENTLTDERALLRRARALDDVALGMIFDTYYPPLYRHIYYHVGQQATAQDLTAEVFARMLEQLAAGRGPRVHLRAWLYRVAHNLVIDDSRRQVHRQHQPLDEGMVADGQDAETQAEMSLFLRQARTALAKLTLKQRAVIILKFLEGYDNKEVSRILGLRVGAVKALQHRALAAMRRNLARMGNDWEDR